VCGGGEEVDRIVLDDIFVNVRTYIILVFVTRYYCGAENRYNRFDNGIICTRNTFSNARARVRILNPSQVWHYLLQGQSEYTLDMNDIGK